MSKLDVEANNVVQQVKPDFPKARPKGVVVSPHQTKLYVSTGRGNMIAVLKADSLEVPGSVKVGRRVWGHRPDARRLTPLHVRWRQQYGVGRG